MSRIVSFVVLVAIVLVIGAFSFQVLESFLVPMFLAVLLVVMFRPLHAWFITRCRGRDRLAAGLTTLAILLIVLVPMLLVVSQAAGEAMSLVGDWSEKAALAKLNALRRRLGLELLSPAVQTNLDRIETTLAQFGEGFRSTRDLPDQQQAADRRRKVADRRQKAQDLDLWAQEIRLELALPPPGAGAKDGGAARGSGSQAATSLARLLKEINALEDLQKSDAELLDAIARAEAARSQLEQDLLGGPLLAWLKREANPNEQQLAELRDRVQTWAAPWALKAPGFVGGFLAELLIGLGVMIVSLYYFLADGPGMIQSVLRLSPLDDRYEKQLLAEFGELSRAVVVATLLSALVQGLLAGAAYLVAGFESVFLLAILTMLLALIPFVGAAAVWVPCCLWLLLSEGRTTAAWLLAVYGVLVVSMADNVIKPLVLKGRSNLHPLLALLSVLGGVKAMGPTGILVGPMVVAFLQTLLNMLQTELDALGKVPATQPAKEA